MLDGRVLRQGQAGWRGRRLHVRHACTSMWHVACAWGARLPACTIPAEGGRGGASMVAGNQGCIVGTLMCSMKHAHASRLPPLGSAGPRLRHMHHVTNPTTPRTPPRPVHPPEPPPTQIPPYRPTTTRPTTSHRSTPRSL